MEGVVTAFMLFIGTVSAASVTMPQPYDTIVIGLGSAGTTAASTLARAGKRVLALEAMDRIGGRVNTVPFGDGIVEVGAEWIHGTEGSRVYNLAVENNITLIPQSFVFEAYRSDGSRYDSPLFLELVEFCMNVQNSPPDEPEPLGTFITRKLKDYLKEKHPEVLEDREFLQQFLRAMNLIINNNESSNDWNDVSAVSNFAELEGDQYTSWHRHGYRTFFDLLLNKYNNGPGLPNLDIKLNTEVTKISWSRDPSESVKVTCADGAVYTANNVIVTVSLGVLKERHTTLFSPALPPEKVEIIKNSAIGVIDKIILSFPEPWWPPDVTFFAFLWQDSELADAKEHWTTQIYGASTPLGSRNCLTLWTNGEISKLVESLPEDVVKTKSMELLRRFMGANRTIPDPIDMIRSKWFSNPFTRGSYTFDNLLVGQFPNARTDLAEPLADSAGNPRVLFAGEATDKTHFSTVHGASDSGYREAMRLMARDAKE